MAYETTPQVRARLRSERKRRNWDIPRMALELRNASEHPHKMPSTVSIQRNIERWESGKVRRITERNRILYSRALSIPEDELFEDKPAQEPPELAEGDLDVIYKMLGALTSTDRQFGGSYAREYAADFLTAVIEPRLRSHIRGSVRRELFAASTEFTMRVSAMHLDSDQPSTSLALLGKAASMASESSETSLTAWVLSRRGEHEIHQAALLGHRDAKHAAHIEQALAYMEGAVGVARAAPPMSRAFIGAKHALAWSMTGDRARTQRALGTAWDAYDRMGVAEEPRWIGAYNWGNLRHEEGRCYINLSMGSHAVRAARDSLGVRHDLRPKAFSLGILAIGYTQIREIDQACVTAHELIRLAERVPSRRLLLRVAEVLQALEPYRAEPIAADVFESARSSLRDSTN